jgi:hypothetical protein
MAGQAGNPGRAAAYLGLYALGLGIPFFLGAAFLGSFLGLIARARKHLALLRRVSALLVILIGAGIALGAQNSLNIALSRAGWALAAGESRLVPALVLGALALLPSAPALIRRKRPGTPALVCSGVLAVLAILQGLGIINGAGLLSRWLLFQGA